MNPTAKTWGSGATPELEHEELSFFCALIEERAGIHMKSAKRDLVRTRLRSRISDHGLNSFSEYRELLSSIPKNDPEWEVFTNLLTTNKTDFFREPKHFDFIIQRILPEWLASGERTFKVWSAACSTGEEPYTLAMILARYLPQGRDFKILATDIDTQVLSSAANAVYSSSKKSEIPAEYQSQIQMGRGEARGWFRIKPDVKHQVTFKAHNLIEREAPGPEIFDLVLCRNVMIYFARETVDFVQAKLHRSTKKSGHLFIGHSESLQGISHRWTPVGPSVFKKDQ